MENDSNQKPEDILKLKQRRKSRAINFGRALLLNQLPKSKKETDLVSSDAPIKSKNSNRRRSQFVRSTFNITLDDPVFNALEDIKEMKIEQVPDIIEAMCPCCCQLPNSYRCFGKCGNEFVEYFFCKEFSSSFMRIICPVNCRKFLMKGKFSYNNEKSDENNFKNCYLRMKKPLKFPILCCCRPQFIIEYLNTEKKYEKIGIIYFEFSICDPIFVIENEKGENIYYIEANYCQLGLMCRNNIFGKTEEAHFFIYKYNNREKVIGDICKEHSSSVMNIADDFSVTFPVNANVKEKLLLMITAIMIDYQYFEKNNIESL